MRKKAKRQWLALVRRALSPVAIIALLGAAVTFGLFLWFRHTEIANQQESFRRASQNRITSIRRALTSVYGWLDAAAAATARIPGPITAIEIRNRFCAFAQSDGNIRAIGWIPARDPHSELYLISCLPEAAGTDAVIAPGPQLRAALNDAASTKRPVTVVAPAGPGIATKAVFDSTGLRGWIVVSLDYSHVVERAVSYLLNYGVHIWVSDITRGEPSQLLTFHRSRRAPPSDVPAASMNPSTNQGNIHTDHITVAGRKWRIVCAPIEGLIAPAWHTGLVALLCGTAVTSLLCLYVRMSQRRTRGIQRLVVRRTKELADARDQALEAVRVKSQFLATMSHEIRTPMNGVIGLADLIADTPLDSNQRDMLDGLRSSARHLLDIVNDILDLSRIEAGKLVLASEPFDLAETVDRAVQMFAVAARAKRIELSHYVPDSALITVEGDSGRLGQVLANLVGNAVKFTPTGAVSVAVSIIDDGPERVFVRFDVIDSGIGLDRAAMSRLFQAFYQVDAGNSRRHGGAGLGLAIAHHLVTIMGGAINVESQPGHGSTFSVRVPLRKLAAVSIARQPLAVVRGTRVVLVGATAASRVAGQYLEGWGTRVERFDDVTQAADQILRTRPADPFLVIADLGCEAVNLSRTWLQDLDLFNVRIILLAPPGQPYDLDVPLRFPPYWVPSPVRRSRLRDALRRALEPRAVVPESDSASPAVAIGGQLLLVEDNLVNQRVAVGLIRKLGYQVEAVSSAREAIDAVKSNVYGAILMDCQMPEMDGFEATAVIRQLDGPSGTIPIIALTANAMPGDREKCLEAGMDDYISKPIQSKRLADVLDRWTRPRVLT